MKRAARGFTMTELLVVVTVVGILAAVALPSYRDATLRGRRTVAKTALIEVGGREENWFTDRKSYTSSVGEDGLRYVSGTSVASFYVDANGRPGASASGALYLITLVPTSSAGMVTSWKVTAAPQNAQQRDPCGSLTLAQDGTKGTVNGRGDCWSR